MKATKKPRYLKRFIVMIMMAGYMALLVLLLVISWYLIAGYQQENREREMGELSAYVSDIEDAMYSVDRHIYDIYAYDENFRALSGLLTELENYQHAYELSETLKNKMLIEEHAHGYFLYYDRLAQTRYLSNKEKIKADATSEISTQLKNLVTVSGSMRSWSVQKVGADVLLSITCRKENAAVCAVHSLGEVQEELAQRLDKKELEVVLIDGETVIQGTGIVETAALQSEIQNSFNAFSGRFGGKYVYAQRLEKTDLWICMVLPYGFWRIMTVQQLMLLILTLCSGFAVLLLYRFLRREFLHPLRELTNIMNRIRTGEADQVPDIGANFHELREVNETLAGTIAEVEKQKNLVYEEIIETQKAKMQYLQLQIKPHFYLNGLKTLNALSQTRETEKLQEFIFGLSDHLRYLLQTEKERVPLYKELAFVKNYVALQGEMSGREVSCSMQIDEVTEQWLVPTLCVQTFVENSIKYARLGSTHAPLYIAVTAEMLEVDGEQLLDLTITDNGQGYDEDQLRALNQEPTVTGENIGINNVKRRGHILYGGRMEYRFGNNRGAVSELIIPREAAHERTTGG